jgi:hypothetical protein
VSATKYWYRVKAYDLLRVSGYSNVISATTPAATTSTSTGSTSTSTGGTTTTIVPGRIKALTARALAGYSDSLSLILKFTVSGSSKSILLRGIGPGLDPYTSSAFLPDPKIKLYTGTTLTGSNDNWGGTLQLISTFKQVGAFPLAGYSKDSAILKFMGANSYTSVVNGNYAGYAGFAQTEVYDADTATAPAGRLTKLSVRAPVKTGSGVLVGGFVVGGNSPIRLLIRAIGPSLGAAAVPSHPRSRRSALPPFPPPAKIPRSSSLCLRAPILPPFPVSPARLELLVWNSTSCRSWRGCAAGGFRM